MNQQNAREDGLSYVEGTDYKYIHLSPVQNSRYHNFEVSWTTTCIEELSRNNGTRGRAREP